ncbi:MAG TPA: hypothetical protein VFN91_10015, partial [Myxococcaceae bacterium]|nr:hypothetical protein [Myxococcaceae bacterium]
MPSSALERFWRGLREPWELLARMRQERGLWGRYWRIVLVQAGLTLVAGLAVFWVGKQGAEAWNDAFGPEEPEASASPVAGGAGSTDATRATEQPPSAGPPASTEPVTPPPAQRAPARPRPGK